MNPQTTVQARRSGELLGAGLRALDRHDLDQAERYLAQLQHEGRDEHYRVLQQKLLQVATA